MDHQMEEGDEEQQPSELQQRHQETAGMNRILNLVQPVEQRASTSESSSIELVGLQEELEKIKRDQDDVLHQLELASSSPSAFSPDQIPPILSQVMGTWKTTSYQNPSSASLSYFPPAFLFLFMWFKLDGYNLHCIFFNGLDHEKTVDPLGVECDGAVDGSKKMTYVEGDRIVTSHRMVADGREFMRIERFIVEGKLHFVFRKGDGPVVTRIYRKAFLME